MKHFNQLTPAEAERLALLLEEMGEAQQVIGKILRHGYDSYHPDDPNGPDNRALLEKEMGDVMAAADMLVLANDLDMVKLARSRAEKSRKVHRYLHHQPVPAVGGGD
jgi:NTP pyrophosphatase (non-canonical NTP hydrolase)